MSHSGDELRLHPLSIREPEVRKRGVVDLAYFPSGAELISFSAGKGNEGRACVGEPLRISVSQQCQRSFCLTITRRANDDKRAFSEAFCLQPRLAASTAVFRRGQFRNNTFELLISAGREKGSGVSSEFHSEEALSV